MSILGPLLLVPTSFLATGSPIGSSVQEPDAARDAAPAEREFAPPSAINAAIDAGTRYLLSRQQLDGSWKPDEERYVAGQTGLSVYTLLKAGVPRTHPAVRRGIAFLRAHEPQWTYGIACCVLALEEADGKLYRDEIERWTERLLEAHGTGFSYPGGHEDLSLTQYGCLALRAAVKVGIGVDEDVWSDLMEYALRVRQEDGSFRYQVGRPPTGSMTAAGVAVLAIVREALEASGDLRRRDAETIDEAIETGIAWLGEHFVVTRNPDPTAENQNVGHIRRWHLYYLYGLERVGGLTGRKLFGDHDWYGEASTHLVKNQHDDGSWSTNHGEKHPGTCFGVLVLKRATAPRSGARPTLAGASYGDDDPERDVSLRITGDTPLTMWVSSFGAAAREKHEWDEERGDGPRVARVEYVDASTDTILATVDGDAGRAAGDERFATQVRMEEPGAFGIKARVYVRPLGAAASDLVALESQVLDVRVDGVMTDAMRVVMDDFGRNELTSIGCEVEASSSHDNHPAGHVADGVLTRGWLASPTDESPWVEIEPDRAQRGDFVVLTPYERGPREHAWGRPTKVRLVINDKARGEFDLDPRRFGKDHLPLGKQLTVRKLRVEILEREEGTDPRDGGLVGFGEVELQDRDGKGPPTTLSKSE